MSGWSFEQKQLSCRKSLHSDVYNCKTKLYQQASIILFQYTFVTGIHYRLLFLCAVVNVSTLHVSMLNISIRVYNTYTHTYTHIHYYTYIQHPHVCMYVYVCVSIPECIFVIKPVINIYICLFLTVYINCICVQIAEYVLTCNV